MNLAEMPDALRSADARLQAELRTLLPEGTPVLSLAGDAVREALCETPARRQQALLLRDGLASTGPLALLDGAHRWLQAEGPVRLLVLDWFSQTVAARDEAAPPGLGVFLELAGRMGWQVQASVTLASQGTAAVRQLVAFERQAAPMDRLHPVAAAESAAMCQLFAEVFGHAMSPPHWRWKYGHGRGFGVGLSRGGRLVAHYGGLARDVLWCGRPARAAQVCDVMVASEANTNLVRKGPMYQISATFLETELGWGRRFPLAFGFPSDRHHRLAERLKLYAAVDAIWRVSWPAATEPTGPRLSERWLQPADIAAGGRHRPAVQRLWSDMAASFGSQIIGVRDPAWLQHRYFEHPVYRYELVLLRRRWTRRPVGLVVLRAHEHHLQVMDLLGPPAAFAALIAAARRRAVALGLPRVDCWITASQRQHLTGIDSAVVAAEPLNVTVPANVHTPGPVDEVRDRWFLLAGDADFT